MRIFIALCFSICLVKGSEGMSRFAYNASSSAGSSVVLCNLDKFQRLNHFLIKPRRVKFRQSASFRERLDLKRIHPYFVMSNALNAQGRTCI